MEIQNLKMYSVEELKEMLEVSDRTVLEYLRAGKLKGVKVGGKWRVSSENLYKFLNGEV